VKTICGQQLVEQDGKQSKNIAVVAMIILSELIAVIENLEVIIYKAIERHGKDHFPDCSYCQLQEISISLYNYDTSFHLCRHRRTMPLLPDRISGAGPQEEHV